MTNLTNLINDAALYNWSNYWEGGSTWDNEIRATRTDLKLTEQLSLTPTDADAVAYSTWYGGQTTKIRLGNTWTVIAWYEHPLEALAEMALEEGTLTEADYDEGNYPEALQAEADEHLAQVISDALEEELGYPVVVDTESLALYSPYGGYTAKVTLPQGYSVGWSCEYGMATREMAVA